MSNNYPRYGNMKAKIQRFKHCKSVLIKDVNLHIPQGSKPFRPSHPFDSIETWLIGSMGFFIESPHQINLYWAGDVTPPTIHGHIPALVMRLRRDYMPANTSSARKAWKRCFEILRKRLGPQFCFTFQVGESAVHNWCFPRFIWLPVRRNKAKDNQKSMWLFNPWDPRRFRIWLSNPNIIQGRTLGKALCENTPATAKNGGYVRPDERVFRTPSSPFTGPYELELPQLDFGRLPITGLERKALDANASGFGVPDTDPTEMSDSGGGVPGTDTYDFAVPNSGPPEFEFLEFDASDSNLANVLHEYTYPTEATDSPSTAGDTDAFGTVSSE
ncbi:hypothetical protein F4678DRAFT_460587 [Xylaria arbuscula]|nr:hypothetical protein F4678DRAFT_460587 [Xylaria arbuscula]